MRRTFPSEAQLRVLSVLQRHPKLYGLQIVPLAKIKRGQHSTIYTLLKALSSKGLVTRWMDTGRHNGPNRPRYTISSSGRRVLRAWRIYSGAK